MVDYEDEGKVNVETESEDSDFAEEHGESVTCMVHRLLCNREAPNTAHDIKFSTQGVRLKTRCAISSSTMKVVEYHF